MGVFLASLIAFLGFDKKNCFCYDFFVAESKKGHFLEHKD